MVSNVVDNCGMIADVLVAVDVAVVVVRIVVNKVAEGIAPANVFGTSLVEK